MGRGRWDVGGELVSLNGAGGGHLVGEDKDWGDQLPGSGGTRACFLHTQKRPPKENETKHQKMKRDNDSHGEGDRRGNNVYVGTSDGRHPRDQQEPMNRLRAERGGERMRDTAEEAVTRRGAKIRAAEAGGWRVEKKSRWTMIHARI